MEAQSGKTRVAARSWYVLAVLSMVSFFNYMDRRAMAVLLQPLKTELHLTDAQLGLLSGFAFAVVYAIVGIPLARMADRGSRVRLLAACILFWSCMTALIGFARNFPQLFLARMGVGVGEAGCVPPAHSLISDCFPRERRALAITIFQTGAMLGLGGGMLFVSFLTEQVGWRASIQIVGVAGLPLALLVLLTVPEARRRAPDSPAGANALATLSALLRRRGFAHLAIAYSISGGVAMGVAQWFPAFFIRSYGFSLLEAGAALGVVEMLAGAAGLIAGGLLATALAPRQPRWELWIPALAFLCCSPLYAMMCLSPTPLGALAGLAVANFVAAIGGGVALAAVQNFAEPQERATAVAVTLFFSSLLGQGFGPYAVGLISDLLAPALGAESLRYALLICCALMLWSSFHFVLAARPDPARRPS